MTEQLLPPANWYADPEGSGRWRYWDGSAWTVVYLNEPQPGPSVAEQWWEIGKPWVSAGSVILMAVSLATGSSWFGGLVALTVISIPKSDGYKRYIYGIAPAVAIAVGTAIHAGWQYGAGMVPCIVAIVLIGRYQKRLSTRVVWPVVAFALCGIGVLLFAGMAPWRG